MPYLGSESDRYLLDLQLAADSEPSLTIVDNQRRRTVSHWQGPAVLLLLGRSCLPALYRWPGRHRCDRYVVGHLICAAAALAGVRSEQAIGR